ncbi:sialate O-acetylesterase [Aurantibacillus circumpalustris]|uniref:sialate O-acetylesterase n=1 Tax=Aurantibacillus circumpalustris TaxID=3036359 RepID=UPI00295B397C|nr:sialate O-acetylesterase [Aurantibacillus circumpalustris]
MIPRGADNMGEFLVTGTCPDLAIKSMRFCLYRNTDSSLIYDKTIAIQTHVTFSINVEIPAALADYRLKIYSINLSNNEMIVGDVDQLVCGDYFIVSGQSNAVGALNDLSQALTEDSMYGNKYCRTIGNMYIGNLADSLFNGEYNLAYHHVSTLFWISGPSGCIGIWPMRILHNITKQTGIPVCILNGAIGSTELSHHLASRTPSDPNKLHDTSQSATFHPYDGLYKKLFANKAIQGVKAILWYQGESDAVLSKEMALTYNERFALLRKSWKLDYPQLEKIFVFQINTGCGGDNVSIIRDQQRKLSKQFNDVIVMPTVGCDDDERAKDGCHYTLKGYGKIGENISPAVLKHIYHFDVEDKYIMGPDINRISYSGKNELCLSFNMDVSVQQSKQYSFLGTGIAYLKDYFYKEDGTTLKVQTIYAENNNVFLTIASGQKLKSLTYLPDIFSTIPTIYAGPWILNKNNTNLGALSFFEFPVEALPNELWFSKSDDSLLIYPNPVKDCFEIRVNKNTELQKLYLIDLSGKIVMNISPNKTTTTLVDMRVLESGIYFLKAYTNAGFFVKKLVLTKNGD